MQDVTNHRGQRTQEYRVGKRDSYVIVAQLSPEFTARLVDRWQELEKQVSQPQVPQSFAEALRLAADTQEQLEQEQKEKEQAQQRVSTYEKVTSQHNHTLHRVVRQDSEGRFNLNDLHKAAGGNPKDRPGSFMRLDTTQSLIHEAERENAHIRAFKSVTGRGGGTFVVKELVYAYAMWISPAFHLKVIRAYDEMVTQPQARFLSPSPRRY